MTGEQQDRHRTSQSGPFLPKTTLFAERLRVELARQNMSGAALGRALGFSQVAVSYWRSGRNEPSLGAVVAIADLLGVTTDYLLGRNA